jgi:hypothetical protein
VVRVTFRDDHDAALARADALQRELDASKRELDAKQRALDDANRKLAAKADARDQPVAAATAARSSRRWPQLIAPLLVLVVMVVTAGVFKRIARTRAPEDPDCTLVTDPPGAEIVGMCHNAVKEQVQPGAFEIRWGRTPLTMSRSNWLMKNITCGGGIVARYRGRPDTLAAVPLAGTGCGNNVLKLQAPD